jgi:nucleoside-diphosphate-sugar epimerase
MDETKNVFVTGGTGFIGSHLCQKLSQKHGTVTLMRDLFPTGTPWGKWVSLALNKTTVALGDILNYSTLRRVLADYSIHTVYHLAACAVVSTAQKDPCGTFQTNVVGTVNLLEACRQLDIPTVYVQTTDKVYGETMGAKEEDPLVSSGGVYESSKACQDFAAQTYAETYGLNVIIGRPCNTFGFDMAKRIIPNTIRSCMRGELPIIYEGENSVRQYIYVEDLTDAILHLTLRLNLKGKLNVFNVATDNVLTQEQVVKKICNYFPLTPRIVKREKPIKEIYRQSLDWTKLKETGWTPRYSFEDGIKETIHKFDEYEV